MTLRQEHAVRVSHFRPMFTKFGGGCRGGGFAVETFYRLSVAHFVAKVSVK